MSQAINFNNSIASYYQYMQQLAQEHVDIQDSKEDTHFFKGELEDFYMGLRSIVKFPALMVEGFRLNISIPQEKFNRNTAFIVVLDYADNEDKNQITTCYTKSEEIGLEILRKMYTDATALRCKIDINDIDCVQVINESERYAGIRFDFILESFFITDIDPTKWQK